MLIPERFAHAQNEVVTEAAARAEGRYAAGGFTTTFDGIVGPWFLPTFAEGVKAGAMSVMVNSGEVNGIPGHANRHLLTDVLRGELGFDGVVVSDWEDIKRLVTAEVA